jgi:DICT domain-containing protein
MSMHLEYKGLDLTETTMLLACLPRGRQFSVAARKRYGRVASRGVFTAVLGVDMPPEPEPQIRGGRLDPDDPLAREWSVIVLGPHFAGALIAREHDRGGPDDLRRFDFLITHDRDAVIAAARPLLNRLLPA